MRSLGEFFGHIVHAIRTDVTQPAPSAPQPAPTQQPTSDASPQRRVVEETRTLTDEATGQVRVRRVLIEETLLPATPPARPTAHE